MASRGHNRSLPGAGGKGQDRVLLRVSNYNLSSSLFDVAKRSKEFPKSHFSLFSGLQGWIRNTKPFFRSNSTQIIRVAFHNPFAEHQADP